MKSKATPKHSWKFDAIGTKWEIASADSISEITKACVLERIDAFDAVYSRFRSDSSIRRMAEAPGEYTLPKSSEIIFDFYDKLWNITAHKVTPMVGDILSNAGYDEAYSLKPNKEISPAPNYQKILHRNGTKVTLSQKALIDIGAVGKGFLVDEITDLLMSEGHSSFVVDGSGDLRVMGERVEVVGLEYPHDPTRIIGTIDVSGRSLCASGVNRRAWGNWHHIIDPTTATPTQEIIATWVIADSAMVADGLATALFFTMPQKLAEQYTYEYMRMHADGSVEYSNYFSKGIF